VSDKRQVAQVIQAMSVSEGAGVTVHRMIGVNRLLNLDPFLMLDHFGSDNPNEYIAGFPDHPHRGFITLTYMIDGQMLHRDSMGNQGNLGPGSVQWMKAASGVIHSEMPQQKEGLMRGFQMWINLPAKEKMSDPEYQEIAASAIPQVMIPGGSVKIIAGDFKNKSGPVKDPLTKVSYFDVALDAGASCSFESPRDHASFVAVYEGSVVIGDKVLEKHHLGVLTAGEIVELSAKSSGAKLIVVAGKPLHEPIVQYGPFVMNTRAEIEQAFNDYRRGALVQRKANFVEKT
jgi:quercetin 2,3-dioxygenase